MLQQFGRAFELGAGEGHAAGSDSGGVADGGRFAFEAGGQEPDAAGVVGVQERTEGAGQQDPVDVGDRNAQRLCEQFHTGRDGAFRQHDLVDVVLGEVDVVIQVQDTLSVSFFGGLDPAAFVDEAEVQERRNCVDEAASADAGGLCVADDVGPQFAVFQPHLVDGTGGTPHAEGDLRAFQRGTGGGGACGHAAVRP